MLLFITTQPIRQRAATTLLISMNGTRDKRGVIVRKHHLLLLAERLAPRRVIIHRVEREIVRDHLLLRFRRLILLFFCFLVLLIFFVLTSSPSGVSPVAFLI